MSRMCSITQTCVKGPPLETCPGCGTSSERSLVVCIDGVSKFGIQNTNAAELFRRIEKDEAQRAFYHTGGRTYTRNRPLTALLELIEKYPPVAASLEEQAILSAYRWIVDSYETGDRIFMFGFSRGAYQVRALSAMIHTAGLVYRGNTHLIARAYQAYAKPRIISLGSGDAIDMTKRFKHTFSRKDVKVHFIGVWDTVMPVHVIMGGRRLPGTSDPTPVCVFRHALALHERRVMFLPDFVHRHPQELESDDAEPTRGDTMNMPTARVKEVWFAGSHQDIGGVTVQDRDLNRFGPALRWMIFEGLIGGLRVDTAVQTWEEALRGFDPSPSMSPGWALLEILPFPRWRPGIKKTMTFRPHLGAWRRVLPHQLIHETAKPFMAPLPSVGPVILSSESHHQMTTWRDMRTEFDPYLMAQRIVPLLREGAPLSIVEEKKFEELVSNRAGLQAIRDASEPGLGHEAIETNRMWGATLLSHLQPLDEIVTDDDAISYEAMFRFFQYIPVMFTAEGFRTLLEVAAVFGRHNPRISRPLLNLLNSVEPVASAVAARPATSAAFIPSSSRVVFGTFAGFLIWDYEEESTIGSYYTDIAIRAVTVSSDGSRTACRAFNGTVIVSRTQDQEIKPITAFLRAQDAVRSLALSPDSSRVVAGCDTGAVILWDLEPEDLHSSPEYDGNPTHLLPQRSDAHAILAMAWSIDGAYIASASRLGDVYIWSSADLQQTRCVSGVAIHSLAFSPESAILAAADQSGIVWLLPVQGPPYSEDIASHRRIAKTHSEPVLHMCFSPNTAEIAVSSSRTVFVHNLHPEESSVNPDITSVDSDPDEYSVQLSSNILALKFMSNSRAVRVACGDGSVRLLFWTFPPASESVT